MRVTNVLCQLNYRRHIQRIWKRQGRLQAETLVVPPALSEMGIPIIDAKEILQETKLFKDPKPEIKTIPVPPSVYDKRKCFYVMHRKTKVSENENQTLSLTKTIRYEGLPSSVSSLFGVHSLPNQDELVQRSLMQAQAWDADQFKLPKKFDVLRPGYTFRRIYGTRNKKQVVGLLENLTNLCDYATGQYEDCFARSKLYNTFADVTVFRSGESVSFKLPCDLLLMSKKPLRNFSSPAEVQNTESDSVPNIYPIKSTLDLEKVEELPDISNDSYNFDSGHLHTLFVAQKSFGWWFPKQSLARAIGSCFAFSATKARQMFGESVGVLPEAICVQCVYMDLKSFNIITYQLNTLDLENDDGVKNQVWVDQPQDLFASVSEREGITGYNPDVFPKLLGVYLNGLIPVPA